MRKFNTIAQLSLPETESEIIYPDRDGQPMADNTIQFRWITIIYYNLAWLFAENLEVFVAGDLLWYPVSGNNKLRQAPDVMVAFGVAKGDRGEDIINNGKKITLPRKSFLRFFLQGIPPRK